MPRPARLRRGRSARGSARARARPAGAGRPRARAGSGSAARGDSPTVSNISATRASSACPRARGAVATARRRCAARHPRVQRGERILEDDVQLAPQRPQLAPRQVRDVGPLSRIVPAVGSTRRRTQFATSTCRCRTPRRARASRPAQARTRRRRPRARPSRRRILAPTRKCLTRSSTSSAGAPVVCGVIGARVEAGDEMPGRTGRSSGTCVRESSSARGQRSAKAHPSGARQGRNPAGDLAQPPAGVVARGPRGIAPGARSCTGAAVREQVAAAPPRPCVPRT